jgi:hypothetical protein
MEVFPMAVSTNTYTPEFLAGRVRKIQQLLFGSVTGNRYRQEAAVLRNSSPSLLQATADRARRALIDCTFDDSSVADLSLAQISRMRPYRAVIFISLDMAKICLMNPQLIDSHDRWMDDIGRTYNHPSGLVIQCLEWLSAA